ncbi:MAG: DNA repair protein RecN [Deltaproteobacteria bacterium]|nr:DNA repair protein RecN [Deltaproteobacteria bacterium]
MLEFLTIKNLAVISDAEIEFFPGLNVITGETGAGKSMVVQALGMLRGDRADSGWIRAGEENAVVGATIDCGESISVELSQYLPEESFDDDPQLVLERIISNQGKNRVRINGSLSKLRTLSLLSSEIIELTSQHDQVKLLSPSNYSAIVDTYLDDKDLPAKLRNKLAELDTIDSRLNELKTGSIENQRRMEILEFHIKELKNADIEEGEYASLLQLSKKISSLSEIVSSAQWAEFSISGDESSILNMLGEIIRKISLYHDIEPEFAEAIENLEKARELLLDASSIFRHSGDRELPDFNPDDIQNKLHIMEKLSKKHGVGSPDELIAVLENLESEFNSFSNDESSIPELENTLNTLRTEALKLAGVLTAERKKCARKLSNQVKTELMDLGFTNADFIVEIEPRTPSKNSKTCRIYDDLYISDEGADKVSFLFSANPGLPPKPLSETASGGEISRIHLAMKCAASGFQNTLTTIYDEVDTGIGGETANMVGKKLKKISLNRQVICITHLPQIAAFADHHYTVHKEIKDNQTWTKVKKLSNDERITEVARMMGTISDDAVKLSKALIENGKSTDL